MYKLSCSFVAIAETFGKISVIDFCYCTVTTPIYVQIIGREWYGDVIQLHRNILNDCVVAVPESIVKQC